MSRPKACQSNGRASVPFAVADTVLRSELLRIYGGLLSEHQRECLELHYNEDLSLAEIGAHLQTSRQAVYDAVRQGRARLERYERVLGLHALQCEQQRRAARVRALLTELEARLDAAAGGSPALRTLVAALKEQLDV